MSIDNLRSALPEWAKDLSLNLSTLSRSSSLTEQQQWGTFVAAAAATPWPRCRGDRSSLSGDPTWVRSPPVNFTVIASSPSA